MELDVILAFALTCAVLVLIPGPVVMLIVANSLSYGTRNGVAVAWSAGAAHATMMGVAALGLTSIMALMSDWFEVIRWIGVAYLIYLGIQQFRNPVVVLKGDTPPKVPFKKLFTQAFIVAWTNPKTLLFYAAFFPQFIDPDKPLGLQMAILCAVFMVVSLVLDSAYALLAGRVRGYLTGERGAKIRNRVTGTMLIGAGCALALTRKA